MRILGFLAVLVAALLYAAPGQSATLYVSNSDPSCAGEVPCFATIQGAVNAAGGGDTVQIQFGVYPEQVLIANKNNSAAATENDRITIETDPLDVDHVVVTGSAGGCNGGYAIRLKRSKFITIRGLAITETGGTAVELQGGSNQNSAIQVERNRIFGNGLSGCDGGITIGAGNPGTLIVNNLIYGNVRNGIAINSDSAGGPHHIIQNTIYGNQWNGVNTGDRPTVFLVNNIITQNGSARGSSGGRSGVRRSGSGSRSQALRLLNNLICGNRLGEFSGAVLDASDSGNLTPNGNEGPGVAASPGCDVPANVFDDDFILVANSPAIDSGIDPRTLGLSAFLSSDYYGGLARPADGDDDGVVAFDMGAVEVGNLAPNASDGNKTTNAGVAVNASLFATDLDSPALSFAIVGNPSHGSLGPIGAPSCVPLAFEPGSKGSLCSATVTYTPAANYTGPDSFTFKVNDGILDSNVATVSITVNAP
jgi:hypothetical protein